MVVEEEGFFFLKSGKRSHFTVHLQWPNSLYSLPDSTGESLAVEQGSGVSVERGMDCSRFVYTHVVLKDPQG